MHELEGIQNAQAEDQAVEAPKTVLEEDNDLEVELCKPTGKSTAAVLSLGERRAVERALTQERAIIMCKSRWQDYKTIHLCSHCITVGNSLLIHVPAEVHPPIYVFQCQHSQLAATQVDKTELPSTHYCPPWVHKAFRELASTNQWYIIGKCVHFLSLPLASTPWTGLWVQLKVQAPHMVDGQYATVGPNLVLGGSAKWWIPLSSLVATRQWSLTHLVLITNQLTKMGHPRTAASREFVLNLQLWWWICNEWIGGIGQWHKGCGQSSKMYTFPFLTHLLIYT